VRLHVVGAAIAVGGRCLVTRRGARASMALKWEFPGGKVEPGEAPRDALRRELLEELGVEIEAGELIGEGSSADSGREIRLSVYGARWVSGQIELREHHELGWFLPEELDGLDWPEADLPVVPAVKAYVRTEATGCGRQASGSGSTGDARGSTPPDKPVV
jgi:8-oxo-dGTP diphosphatase